MRLSEVIEKKTQEIEKEIIQWRRQIHQRPELELRCDETAALVSSVLQKHGLEVITGIAQTGVVGILRGDYPGPVAALRVDMDALPIQEQTNLSFASQNHGVMHACGHDGHTAIGLGVAAVLSELKPTLKGTVKFIFQPGEEKPGGAKLMMEGGVLQNPDVEVLFGFHIFPDVPSGSVGISRGVVCAGNVDFEITLTGRGGHGAKPELCNDPITAAGFLITGIQSIVSRNSDPRDPLVISICQITGGDNFNVIPEKVFLKGTIRAFNDKTHKLAQKRLSEILQGLETGFGLNAELRIVPDGTPVLRNDLKIAKFAEAECVRLLGRDSVIELDVPSMGADDFAYFANEVPSAYLRLGCHDESKGFIHKLHEPYFDFDEKILAVGTKVFSHLLASYLNEQQHF